MEDEDVAQSLSASIADSIVAGMPSSQKAVQPVKTLAEALDEQDEPKRFIADAQRQNLAVSKLMLNHARSFSPAQLAPFMESFIE